MPAETGSSWPRRGVVGSIAIGGLAVGLLDGLDAVVVWAVRGVGPARVFQGIAAGLLGPEARSLGAPAALLGVAIHFFIATVVVAVLVLATRARPRLTRRPLVTGALYGVGVWLVMNFAVIPLAFDLGPRLSAGMVANGLFAHVFLVGLPAVWAARRATRVATRPGRTAAEPSAAEQS